MFYQTFWKVGLYNVVSRYPAISCRCQDCNASGLLQAPLEKFYRVEPTVGFENGGIALKNVGKQQRGTVAMGMAEARAFRFQHHPTCRGIAAQYQAVDAAEQALGSPRHQIYLLEQAVSQAERELDRAYISKLHWKELSQIDGKLEAARTALAQANARLKPLIERLEANVTATKTALENARGESAPEQTLAEFEAAMARYLPKEDTSEPTPPGTQRVNGHLIEVF